MNFLEYIKTHNSIDDWFKTKEAYLNLVRWVREECPNLGNSEYENSVQDFINLMKGNVSIYIPTCPATEIVKSHCVEGKTNYSVFNADLKKELLNKGYLATTLDFPVSDYLFLDGLQDNSAEVEAINAESEDSKDLVLKDSDLNDNKDLTIDYIDITSVENVDEYIKSKNLNLNVINKTKICLQLNNLIPLYVGRAGNGKTYHVDNIAPIICNWLGFKSGKYVKYSCTNGNAFDLQNNRNILGNKTQGFLTKVVDDAESNPDILYCVALDEVYNLDNIRACLGYLFSNIRPRNMIILANGNNSSLYDMSEKWVWSKDYGVRRRFVKIDFDEIFGKDKEITSFLRTLVDNIAEDRYFYNVYLALDEQEKISYEAVDFNILSHLIKLDKPADSELDDYIDYILKSLFLEEYEESSTSEKDNYNQVRKELRRLMVQ